MELVVVDWDLAMVAGERIPEELRREFAQDKRYPVTAQCTQAGVWFNSWSLLYATHLSSASCAVFTQLAP